jgi:hypothetical protein
VKSAGRKLLFAVFYLAFLGVFVEVSLQAFYYFTAGDFLFKRVGLPIYAPDEWAGMWNKPNFALEHHTNEFTATYYTNEQGLRVPERERRYAPGAHPGVYRIMLLGPSFAYGWGVSWEESFAGYLEEFLERSGFASGQDVELINAGVPSLPPAPGLRWFEHVGSELRPDLVIQFLYGSMAVTDDERINGSVDADGYLVPEDTSTSKRVRSQIKKLATVFYGWLLWTRLDALRGDTPDGDGRVLGAGREMKQAEEFDPARPEVVEALGFYRRLADTVRTAGSELLLVYFPLSYAIHPEDEIRWRHLGVQDVEGQMAFDAAFVEYLNGISIPCLDATGELRRAAATERLYYWLDIHWTAAGNRVTARTVADHLLGEGQAAAPGPTPPPG